MRDVFDKSKINPRKQKRVNSKVKGNSFERKICKLLNSKFNTKEFCRSPGSGAFGTTHNHLPEEFKVYGDLITPKNFKFIIECKKGYNSESIGNFFKPNSQLRKFTRQAEKDAKKSGREAMIVFQQDRSLILVITKENTFPNTLEHITYKDKSNSYNIHILDDLLLLDNYYFFEGCY